MTLSWSSKILLPPTLFLSHGMPTLLTDPMWSDHAESLRALGRRLERPEAILVLSAHWGTVEPVIDNSAMPETIHDFRGFPEELYRMRYPAPGAPAIARQAGDRLRAAGLPAQAVARGLDHGAWVPLRLLFPEADIPVLQVSIQPHRDAAHHWRLGEALRPLRQSGVLILGSGSLTHPEPREARFDQERGTLLPWAQSFVDWFEPRIQSRSTRDLLDYRALAPSAARVHPTDEHLLPLFAAMAAAGEETVPERLPVASYCGVGWVDSYRFA